MRHFAQGRRPTWPPVALHVALACALSVAPMTNANADTPSEGANSHREAAVLAIDQQDLVIDWGTARGAIEGGTVEIWRPFRVRHPVTGRTLSDRFRIGTLKLVQVQHTLSLARPEGELARVPLPGDIVVAIIPAPGDTHAALPTAESGAPASEAPVSNGQVHARAADEAPASDREARELWNVIMGMRGRGPAERVARYQQAVSAHQAGRFALLLAEEAAALRAALSRGAPAVGAADPNTPRFRVHFDAPFTALAGQPLALALESATARGAVLHLRRAGEVAYTPIAMRAAGAGYYRAQLSAAQVTAPVLDYFVEEVDARGVATPLLGSPEQPMSTEIVEPPTPTAPPHADTTMALFTDYADYNRLRGNDYAWQTEGYFGLRYRDVGVRALRTGFGVYRGVGGSVDDLDTLGLPGRKVGLTYGYLEGEYATSRMVALVARLVIGLTDAGINGGGQFFLRLGNDRLTNLLLGGEALGGIGIKGVAELQWNTIARVPIVIRTEVTNQPAGARVSPIPSSGAAPAGSSAPGPSTQAGDVGARAMVQVGYRVAPSFTVAVRASYEGRTIQHAGPGAGAGVSYQW